jgi:chorismate synthase
MSGNTFGRIFRLTTFGESHGLGLGGVIDGCPAGIPLNEEDIQEELDRRKPGSSKASTTRQEADRIQILSGVFQGYTTGTTIGFYIENTQARSQDYEPLKQIYRPGHADFTYEAKYGIRDYRGGGRASGRETISRVVGGAVAQKFLSFHDISVTAYAREIGGIEAELISPENAQFQAFFAPDPSVVEIWNKVVEKARKRGDSIGGLVEIKAEGVPPGLGEPVFDKLDARLAYALMGVGAIKSVEIGAGREVAELYGSQNNDPMNCDGFTQNNAGGILGGISSGQPLFIRCAVKPIPSISLPQKTLNTRGEVITHKIQGRHDVCAIPRIVPVLKAMTLLVLADMWLLQFAAQDRVGYRM